MLERLSQHILEISAVAIILFLVVNNSAGFSQVTASLGNVFTSGVRALQAR